MPPEAIFSLVLALAPAIIAGAVAVWAISVGTRERKRNRLVDRQLEAVRATERAFQADVDYLVGLLHGDRETMRRAGNDIAQHRPYERVRYYGRKSLLLKWWDVRDRIEAAHDVPPAPGQEIAELADELLDVMNEVRRALFDAEDALLTKGKWSGEQFGTDPEIAARQQARRQTVQERLARVIDETRAWGGRPP